RGAGHDGVREQLGAALAAVHTVTGGRFGYTGSAQGSKAPALVVPTGHDGRQGLGWHRYVWHRPDH
ncbi:hypothetical protein, partial [Catellatospora sp. NPDC049609]|uniref:hypothetical protein n=1 Tax=Catellatospora sp. NPDC049609 TaxID=3155505 RepID=UPI0034157194